MPIYLDQPTLIRRKAGVQKMLRVLAVGQIHVQSQAKQGRLVLYAHDGTKSSGVDIENQRFRTGTEGFFGNYYERWEEAVEPPGQYLLDRVYLHILMRGREAHEAPSKVLALHCETRLLAGETEFKEGLHFHLSAAPTPLDRAHLAIAHLQRDELLSSIAVLDESLNSSMALIRAEILDHIRITDLLKPA
ncbi:MAG: hypothetical protein O3B84_08260 [Chloroflexi bacterium]|nr:hypothetical protein [Chloroflexota bacterium]